MKTWNKKLLSASITGSMTMLVCGSLPLSYASDIEIYSNSVSGITTITMMLDTSGSMTTQQSNVGKAACDLPKGVSQSSATITSRPSNTTPSYTRYYCEVGGGNETRFYYKRSAINNKTATWYKCATVEMEGSVNRDNCVISLTTKPILTDYNETRFNILGSKRDCRDGDPCFYYKDLTVDGEVYYDRLTKLKDAIFSLLDSNLIDSNKVALGIGQYSTQSDRNNISYGHQKADGVTGKIVVPAQLLTDTQKNNIRTAVAALTGYNGTPTANAYAEVGAYMLGGTTSGIYQSGFSESVTSSKNTTNYISPLSTSVDQCSGQGIYFLTDGNPNNSSNPFNLMKSALGATYGSSFSISDSGKMPSGSESGNGMSAVGEFAKALRNKTRNPKGLEIKTAVVGFGAVFDVDKVADAQKAEANRVIRSLQDAKGVMREYYDCSKISNQDAKNACNWGARSHSSLPGVGGFGEGGFYSAQSSDEIIQSIVKFLDEVKPEFDPVATGRPTLPVDSLNPVQIQPYAYYASFVPKPQESTQLWVGNLNKYNVYKGQLFNSDNTIALIKADGSLDRTAEGYWDGGVLSQLNLRDLWDPDNKPQTQRIIFTNRQIIEDSGNYLAQSTSNTLNKVDLNSLMGSLTISSEGALENDPDKNYWLNLLGYSAQIGEDITVALLKDKPELRQVGSVLHSTPILLTQEGKIEKNLTSTNRKDYLLFGSTQGLLHVVDSKGKEVFAFAPHEMMENQKVAFLSESNSTGGTSNLFYGIDAPWTVYSQYVTKEDGTLTVYDAERSALDENASSESLSDPVNNLKGLQWVYGGLRMGGRSYYALDLTNINSPQLKFHINPDDENAPEALKKMGQSWSKPTLGFVNWNGQKKLVMFVGGGYDSVYEVPNANPDETNGNGIYMFDASTGELLWWASNTELEDGNAEFTENTNLKYSVVSQINTVDRNGDGLIDHLYFGDLGGQGFRADINNKANDSSEFGTRVVRLFNENKSAGISPRFYEMPSVSIHEDESLYAVVAFSSGNRSSPLAGLAGSNTVSARDGVFAVFDNDVIRKDLYKANISLHTSDVGLLPLDFKIGVRPLDKDNKFNGGWIGYYGASAGEYKGMNDLYALDNILYVNVYHRDGVGVGGTCGAGVKGDSYLFQYCLPYGTCGFYDSNTKEVNRVKIGVGILGTGLGDAYNNAKNQLGLVVNRDETLDCTKVENKNLPECQLFDNSVRLKQLRWYETQ
ncbi:pilus assembly protein PilY [Acinetobacter sp. YIM 103518]|uniref:Pilus assembly protein PilY n=1 Tax=Acinetobacter faecalis TaxID=2665161 RepID=A0A6L6GHV9_9GAMM|nr:PilC/PilY family type IV pilus protein [Acinetobacter faecalis]MTD12088.1 pilus assembly protein PilY [Acinetobacter faecalis]